MARKRQQGNGSGTVYPRKNKDGKVIGYRGSYFTPGKRRYVSGKTKSEAHRALRKATADRDGGLVFDAGSITLGEYLDRWLNTSVRDTVHRSTYVRYEGLVRNHIRPSIGRMKLKGLTPTHVRSLYRKKLDSGLAPRSVNYIHVTLHKALKQTVLDGLVPRNAAEGVKAPQVHKEEVKPLSPTQVRALLSAASGDRLEVLYLLAIHTGLRQGELLGLKWSDIDLDAGMFSVQCSLDADDTFNPPKRNKSRRTVKLTSRAAEVLQLHRKRQNEERLRAAK